MVRFMESGPCLRSGPVFLPPFPSLWPSRLDRTHLWSYMNQKLSWNICLQPLQSWALRGESNVTDCFRSNSNPVSGCEGPQSSTGFFHPPSWRGCCCPHPAWAVLGFSTALTHRALSGHVLVYTGLGVTSSWPPCAALLVEW